MMANPRLLIDENAPLRIDLCRLARFGANIVEAFSCLLFLPSRIVRKSATPPPTAGLGPQTAGDTLSLVGFHSLSTSLLKECVIPVETGLIGWVSKNNRSIHVSPFDRDSRTLGVYTEDEQLKSWIGTPIPLDIPDEIGRVGVIACDSKKSFAFSKLQGKLTQELAEEARSIVRLHCQSLVTEHPSTTHWKQFFELSHRLNEALGGSADLLRVKITNGADIESAIGIGATVDLYDQVHRLIQQTLPPHFPLCRLPEGDLIMCVDNMMTLYLQNRIMVVCEQLGLPSVRVSMTFTKQAFSPTSSNVIALEKEVSVDERNRKRVGSLRGSAYGFSRS